MSEHWQAYRSLTRDPAVGRRKVNRVLVRRILGYAGKYRSLITIYLITLVFVSLLSVAQPLMIPRLVDDGINEGNSTVVTVSALIIAGLAILDAGLGLVSRYYSSRIGEGLIYDLRTEVYDHVQSQSVAFFTRAQTGALISRLNSDVIGAQQAFTSTLGGVLGNLISVVIVLTAMFVLSWQVTVVVAPARAAVPTSGPLDGPTAADDDARGDGAERRHERPDERAVQRRRCTPREAVRASGRRDGGLLVARRPSAGHRCPHGHGEPMVLHRPRARRVARDRDHVRARRQPGRSRAC